MSSLWRGAAPLLLASTSPTRRALLDAVGLDPETRAPGVDERALEASLDAPEPAELALSLARAKALAVSMREPDRIVVGADQVLACGGEVLHRAASPDAALAQLERLAAARHHHLHSAFVLARAGAVLASGVETATLTMRPLDRAALDTYAAALGPERLTASVGGYQVEGLGLHLFERIDGDHSTILGLPLIPLLAALRGQGLLAV